MPLPRELVDAIAAHPENAAGYLVAGDLLNSLADPWGELIAASFQLSRETDPGRFVHWKKELERLTTENAQRWFGSARVPTKWKLGFVEELEIDDAESLESLFHSELGRLCRRVVVHGARIDPEPVLQRLGEADLPMFDGLSIDSDGLELSRAVPQALRSLRVRATSLPWAALNTSRLERLELFDVHDDALLAWVPGLPPTLRHLELSECELPLQAVGRLIEAQRTLETLHLESDLPNEALAWLARSKALSNVKHLAVGGPMTDPGLDAVLKDFARFSRLKTLVLYGGRFGADRRKWAFKQLPQLQLNVEAVTEGWWQARRAR